ncbi:uncharacterized protein LOC118179808 isoform X2 [Stegodyphus dumicola]|nr:uncharacterized protein LOC118179808 isoform X2 [Stegodyphus dumicola]
MIRSINLKQSDAELEGEISANVMEFFSALKLESLLFCIDTKPSCTLMANILMKFPGKFLHKPTVYQDRLPVMFPESFIEQFGCLPVLSCRGGFFVWQKLPESSIEQNLLFSPCDTAVFCNYSRNMSTGINLNEANGSLCAIKDNSNGIENISEKLKTNQEQCSAADKLEEFKNIQGQCSDAVKHLANKLMYSTSLSEKKQSSNTDSTQNPMFINPVVGSSCSLETNAQASLNTSYGEDHVKNNSPLLNGTSTSSPIPLSNIIRPSTYETPIKSMVQEMKNKEVGNSYIEENSLNNLVIFGNGDIKDNCQGKINVSSLTEESMLQANIQQCIRETGMGNSVSCSNTYSRSDLILIGNKNVERDTLKNLNVCHKGNEILQKKVQQHVNEEEAGKGISCKNNSSSSDLVLAENENALGAIPRKARHRKNKNKVADPTFIAQAIQTDPVNEIAGFDSNSIKILMNKIQQLTSSFEELLAEKSTSFAADGLPPHTDCSNHQVFASNGAAYAHSMHPRVLNSCCCNNFSNMNCKCNQEKNSSYRYAQKESSDIYGNPTNRFQFQEGCNAVHCCSMKNHCYDFHDHYIPRCGQMSCCSLRNYYSTLKQPNIVIPIDNMSNDIISQLISILKTSSQP